jgi:MoaA/NifB/PqqE/SkfB family radical SAM enzyme
MDAVRLTGGEPFVRRDLLEISQIAQRRLKPLMLHVTTNGFLTDRVVNYCEQRDRRVPLQMLVSIDGVGEKHNHVRGSTQAWNMVLETIRTLAPRQKALGLRLGVNQTIVDAEGAEHCRQLREILRPMGIHNNVVMAYDMSATYNTQRDVDLAPTEVGQFSTFGEFTDQNLRELLDQVENDVKSLPWGERLAKRYYLRGIRNRLLEKRGTPNPKCVALNAHLRIFPNGDIPTCQFNSRVVGNLREQSFREIWESVVATEQRDWVKRCPGCWAECEVLPSAIYTLDLLKPVFAMSR